MKKQRYTTGYCMFSANDIADFIVTHYASQTTSFQYNDTFDEIACSCEFQGYLKFEQCPITALVFTQKKMIKKYNHIFLCSKPKQNSKLQHATPSFENNVVLEKFFSIVWNPDFIDDVIPAAMFAHISDLFPERQITQADAARKINEYAEGHWTMLPEGFFMIEDEQIATLTRLII